MSGRALLASIVVVVALAFTPMAAHAQTSPPGWTLVPASSSGAPTQRAFFDYSLAPGQALQDFVRLSNPSDHDLTFQLYATDGYTTPEGAFALRLPTEARTGVGAWTSLPFGTRTVPAGTAVTFPFQIGVPKDASPGDWAGGIVASIAETPPATAGSGVQIQQGVGARIYLRVQGALQSSLAVTGLQLTASGGTWQPFGHDAHATVTYEVTNTGNVRLSGTAQLDVVDESGAVVKAFDPQPLPELLPHDVSTFSASWDGLPLTGRRYRARLHVTAPQVDVTNESPAVTYVPIPVVAVAIAALLVGVLAVVWVVRRIRRRKGRYGAKPTAPPTHSRDGELVTA